MEFDRKELGKALAALKAARVTTRQGIPALTGVLVEAADGEASITGTDLEFSVRATVAATGGGRFLVPFGMFAEAVKTGTGERVTVEADAGAVRVDGGEIRLLPVEDFPTVAATAQELGAFDAAEFSEAAATVLPAASGDDARPVLTGVLVEADAEGSRLVTTDSYRLHIADMPGARVASWSGIVPARAVKYVAARLGRKPSGSVRVFLGESSVMFGLPGIAATVRVIEGEFPNYRQLVPERRSVTGDGLTLRYNLAAFLAALKAARPYCSEGGRGNVGVSPLRIEFRLPTREDGPGGVFLSASRPDVGTWGAELTGALFEGSFGEKHALAVAFNVDYLAASLTAAGEGAVIELRDGLKPLLAFDAAGRRTCLLMPVRLPAAVEAVREPEPEPEPVAEIAEDQDQEPEPVEDQDQDGEAFVRCEHGYRRAACHEPECSNVALCGNCHGPLVRRDDGEWGHKEYGPPYGSDCPDTRGPIGNGTAVNGSGQPVAAEIAGAYAPYIAEREGATLPEPPERRGYGTGPGEAWCGECKSYHGPEWDCSCGVTVFPPPPESIVLPPPPVAVGGA